METQRGEMLVIRYRLPLLEVCVRVILCAYWWAVSLLPAESSVCGSCGKSCRADEETVNLKVVFHGWHHSNTHSRTFLE